MCVYNHIERYQGYGAGPRVFRVRVRRSDQGSLRLGFACLSITTSRDIRVRALGRGSLGLVFACLSITISRDIRVSAPYRGSWPYI